MAKTDEDSVSKGGFMAMAQACTIMAKYNNGGWPFGAEHDVIYASVNPEDLSAEDKALLKNLGWEEDDEGWMCMFP